MKRLFTIFLLLFYIDVFAKFPLESTDKLVKRVISHSDIVFIGKVLGNKTIQNGLILNDKYSSAYNVGIWEVEVSKVYRGNVHVGDKRYICSWTNKTEYDISLENNKEYVFSGVVTGKYIQLPGLHGRILPATGLEKEIAQGLKLPIVVKHDKKDINALYDDQENAVKRDVCYEDENPELMFDNSSKIR